MSQFEIDEIAIGVDGWIIQDGNYGDFRTGDEVRCAFEFHGDLVATTRCTPSMTPLRHNNYRVRALVVFAGPNAWIPDFDLAAFQESRPPEFARTGAWVEGEIELAIDPFMYKDRLKDDIGMPDLFKTWQITRIQRDDTPWIASSSGKIFSPERDHPHWTEVQHTDAWNDDIGRSAYLLHLRVLDQQLNGR